MVYFSTDDRDRILDAANRIFPWAAIYLKTIVSEGFQPDPKASEPSRNGLLSLFKLKNNEFLLLQGIGSPEAMPHLMIADDGSLQIKLATFGTAPGAGDIPLIAYARGKNMYDVFQHQTGTGMGDSRMLSFGTHPETFPNGFKPIMEQRSEKIKWMGVEG